MKIICLEGCSGTGKTEQYHLLDKYYKDSSLNHLAIVEKDYEPFKTAVRDWHRLKGPEFPFTEEDIRLFARKRAETFKENFLSKELDLILLDRYFYTSAVYQRGILTPKEILQINLKYGAPMPNMAFLFDCDPHICFDRAQRRNKKTGGKSLFSTSPEKIEEIRENYISLMKDREEVTIVNTNRPIKDVTNYLIYEIQKLFQ